MSQLAARSVFEQFRIMWQCQWGLQSGRRSASIKAWRYSGWTETVIGSYVTIELQWWLTSMAWATCRPTARDKQSLGVITRQCLLVMIDPAVLWRFWNSGGGHSNNYLFASTTSLTATGSNGYSFVTHCSLMWNTGATRTRLISQQSNGVGSCESDSPLEKVRHKVWKDVQISARDLAKMQDRSRGHGLAQNEPSFSAGGNFPHGSKSTQTHL